MRDDTPPEIVDALRHVIADVFQKYIGKNVEEYRDALTREATEAVYEFLPLGHEIPRDEIEENIVRAIDMVFGPVGINVN